MTRGVYFLANDDVLDQAIAFLNSFRTYNPAVPLRLVPFDDDAAQVRGLADRYGFTVWEDADLLRQCDQISRLFHDGRSQGQYRKLAMWSGPFDRFIYIDCDTIVQDSIDFTYDYLDTYAFVTSHSDMPEIRQFVWRDSIYRTGALTDEQIGYATNTGFVCSRRGLIDPRRVLRDVAEPLALAPHMELMCMEQPLLNYLIVTSDRPYSSLHAIARATRDDDIPQEQWAGHDIGRVHDGRLIPSGVSRILLVHWAGQWQEAHQTGHRVPYHGLWQHYRSMPVEPAWAGAHLATRG